MRTPTQTASKYTFILIATTAAIGLAAPIHAEPPASQASRTADTSDQRVAAASAKKTQRVVDYSQGGTSMTGSHLPMPVLKYQGHYYVGSAFTAHQIVVVDHSGTGSRVISVDEVSNLPAKPSKSAQPVTEGKSKQPADSFTRQR